ncbi:CHC2 zinc finger domain-containing protein [Flavobacterium psychrophilum]
MEITQIKQSLSLSQILHHYVLSPNKNNMLNCPFHEDKTASLQVNLEKNFYKCHACGKKGDQIQFVQDKENGNKHEALLKCVKIVDGFRLLVDGETPEISSPTTDNQKLTINFSEIFQTLKIKLNQSSKAKDYLKQRNLKLESLEMGYNTGATYDKLKCCLIFPLKNCHGQTVSLYGRSIYENPEAKHFYTSNRTGLYPNYPKPNTKYLILTEAIIDASTLLQIDKITKDYEILSCYGTNGLTNEHLQAIKNLKNLEEIIFFFDGDLPGQEAVEKHANQLIIDNEQLIISAVQTPENEDINSLLQGHAEAILIHLIENRTLVNTSDDDLNTKIKNTEDYPNIENLEVNYRELQANQSTNQKPSTNNQNYEDEHLKIEVLGSIDSKDLSALRVTISVTNKQKNNYPSRQNINLYNDDQVEKTIRKIAEKIEIGTTILNKAFHILIEKLEKYREENQKQKSSTAKNRYPLRTVTKAEEDQALLLLKAENLAQIIQEKLQQTGIIGEEKNAEFLFLILLSHKMYRTLHAMIQGTSGSGKSHLIAKVGDTMYDQNKVKRFTRVTDKSFYNYGEYDLENTGIILEDYDGLSEEAEMAWRELQSNGKLSSSVSQKNEQTGEILTGEKYVFGPIASLVATTKFRIYEDNESRVFTIAIDESEAQTERVLDYMAKKSSKEITSEQEQKIQQELQNMVYLLQPYQVQNSYRLELPKNVKHRRRLTQMLHDFIDQVTILYQYQRQKLNEKTLITKVQDLEIAVDLMFNSIVIKADELDGILRQFYEDLKKYIQSKGQNYEFTQREIRQYFRISKTQAFRYFTELQELEYIHKSNVGSRNTHQYQISFWDNIEKLRAEIRQHLQAQIDDFRQ